MSALIAESGISFEEITVLGVHVEDRAGRPAATAAELVAQYRKDGSPRPLEHAINLLRAALDRSPENCSLLLEYGKALMERAWRLGRPEDADASVAACRDLLRLTAPDDPERAARLIAAADAHMSRWPNSGDTADFEHAVGLFQEALSIGAVEAQPRLGNALAMRVSKGQGPDRDAAEAVARCRGGLATVRETDPDWPRYLTWFAFAAFIQAGKVDDVALLDEALVAIGQALDMAEGAPDRWARQVVATSMMFTRLVISEEEEYLGRVRDFAARTVSDLPKDLPARRTAELIYGLMLYFQLQGQEDQADRDEAISMLEAGLHGLALADPSRPTTIRMITELRIDRCLATYRLSDIDDVIAFLGEQLAMTPDDAQMAENTKLMMMLRFEITGDPADLSPSGHSGEDLISLQADLIRAASDAPADLDRSIASAELALAGLATDDPRRFALRSRLSSALEARYLKRRRQDDLGRAIDIAAANVEESAEEYVRGTSQCDLARLLLIRTGLTGDRTGPQPVSLAEQAVRAIPPGHPLRAAADHIHGVALLERYRHGGAPADLAAAITALQAASDATPVGRPQHQLFLASLSTALQDRFELYGEPADSRALAFAAEQSQTAEGTTFSHALQAGIGRTSLIDYLRTGDPAALDAAVSAFREAIRQLPGNQLPTSSYWSDLSVALKIRAELTGARADLDDAIDAGRKAVEIALPSQQEHGKTVANLADALRMRSNWVGDRDDIEEAVAVAETALEMLGDAPQDRLTCQLALASALTHRAAFGGDRADLDRAIAAAREVLREMPEKSPHRALGYQVLAGCLWTRAKAYSDIADLDDAIAVQELAISAAPRGSDGQPADHRQLWIDLYNKAGMLLQRHDHLDRAADLELAIAAIRTARESMPASHPHRVVLTSGLAMLLGVRYGESGQPGDLTAAAEAATESLTATRPGDPLWPSRQHIVGYLKYSEFLRANRISDLRAAIRILTASVRSTPSDHPNLGVRAHQLSSALLARYELRGRRRDVQRALTYLRIASRAPYAGTETRLLAARGLGSVTMQLGQPAEALDAYLQCVQELLPILVWRGLGRASQQRHLKNIAGLACEAAAVALTCDAPRLAVQLLEQGRGVLWSQLLETRSDRTQLYASHPDLAQELDRVCRILDSRDREDFERLSILSDASGSITAGRTDSESDQRRRAATRFEELRDQIRSLPGFADFLRPPSFAALQQAAAAGPVAIINVDSTRCDAIIVTADDLQVLPLVHLTRPEAIQRAKTFRDSLKALSADATTRVVANQSILATLEWLWTTIAAPVLQATADRPRIWWYLTGPLSALPIHAAGLHRPGSTGEWVGDHAVSSYTSTLQALLNARAAPRPEYRRPILAVGLHRTPRPGASYRDLPAVPAELQVVRDAFGPQTTILEDAAATRPAVLASLPVHERVHFACHGDQNPADPSASRLALFDTDLTLLDVVRTGTIHAEFAMLSACRTAQGEAALADESIHLGAAFQLAGYRHVIGTLWNLRDTAAPEVARGIYAKLANPQAGQDDAATALHDAVLHLKQLPGFRGPIAWAPYIHFGP